MPLTVPVKLKMLVVLPLHTTSFAGTLTAGVGLTVMVKLCGMPVHPLAVGVTVIVAITGAVVLLITVKLAMLLSVPLAARPMVVSEFVQL